MQHFFIISTRLGEAPPDSESQVSQTTLPAPTSFAVKDFSIGDTSETTITPTDVIQPKLEIPDNIIMPEASVPPLSQLPLLNDHGRETTVQVMETSSDLGLFPTVLPNSNSYPPYPMRIASS